MTINYDEIRLMSEQFLSVNPNAVLELVEEVERWRNQFICVQCETLRACADEDGCCTACGMDCLVVENGELSGAGAVMEIIADADCESSRDEVAELKRLLRAARDYVNVASIRESFDNSVVDDVDQLRSRIDAALSGGGKEAK